MPPGAMPRPRLTTELRPHRHVFYPGGENESAPGLLSLLLLLSGDVELNPGPSYPCPVCGRDYAPRRGAAQCSTCGQWLCLTTRCSGLTNTRQYTPGWCCLGCRPAPPTTHGSLRPSTPPPPAPPPAPRRPRVAVSPSTGARTRQPPAPTNLTSAYQPNLHL